MRSRPLRPGRAAGAAALIVLLLLLAVAPGGRSVGYPPAPPSLGRAVLSNLSAPSVAPGAASSVAFRLADPAGFFPLAGVVLELELYAWNGYPGDAVGSLPDTAPPALSLGGQSGRAVNVSVGPLAAGGAYTGAVRLVTSAATPAGTYAIRTAVSFTANGSAYLFESRGWFSASVWANATQGPNGTGTVNASRLGVSGVVPETAVYVAPSGWPWAIGALVAGGFVLVGLGAWLYFRRGPRSSSGTA